MASLTLRDGSVIKIPNGLKPEQIKMLGERAMNMKAKRTPATGQGKAPSMTLPQAGSLALESLGQTAGDIGYVATHGPETAAALDAAFNASAKRFGEDPLGTAWGAGKGMVQGAIESVGHGLRTTTGLVGQIPGAPQLDRALGGDPQQLQSRINEANLSIANQPIGTAMDVAGIIPVTAVAGRGAASAGRAGARTISGQAAADRLLARGLTPDLERRRAQFGPEATTLDVQPPGPRDRVLSYFADLPRAEMDPLNERLRSRGLLSGERHRETVTEAAGLPPGALLQPRAHSGAVAARSRALQDQYAEQATRQRDAATRARNAAAEARKATQKTERNSLYANAFAKNADMPLDEFQDIINTKAGRAIWDTFDDISGDFQASRGYGMGNLERLDKMEELLVKEGETMGISTPAGRSRVELAQRIRDRLADPDRPGMEDYRNALETHSRVANAPAPAELSTRQVRMPQNARDALAAQVNQARATERLATPTVMRRLRDASPEDIRDRVEHLLPDIMQGGINRERAFEELRKLVPEGRNPGAWNALKRNITSIISTAGLGGVAATLHSLGMPYAGAAVAGTSVLLGGASAVRRGHRKRVGRRMLENVMEQFPEPEPYVDVNLPPRLLGRRGTP